MLFPVIKPDPDMSAPLNRALFVILQCLVAQKHVCIYGPIIQEENQAHQGYRENQAHRSQQVLPIEGDISEDIVVDEGDGWRREYV